MKTYYVYYKSFISCSGILEDNIEISEIVTIEKLNAETIKSLISGIEEGIRKQYLVLQNKNVDTFIISLIELEN